MDSVKKQGIDPLYAWFNSCRPLPYMGESVVLIQQAGSSESFALDVGAGMVQGGFGGYLPVLDVIQAVLKTGWRGPLLYEVFYEESMSKEDGGAEILDEEGDEGARKD